MAFTRTWDATYEANPEGTDQVNFGDDEIRFLRVDTRERGNLEHDWGTVAGTDTGRHKFPVGNLATRAGITDLIANGQIFLRTSDRPGLDERIAGAWVERFFYDILTTAARTALTNVNKGYVVYDTDIDDFFRGDGAGGWKFLGGNIDFQVTAASVADESPGAVDTWTDISGLTKSVTVPNDGTDYLILVVAIIKFTTNEPRTVAFRLMEDATSRDVAVSAGDVSGPSDHKSTATVAHVKTDGVNNTSYVFKGQMIVSAGGTAADLDVNPTVTLAGAGTVINSKLITCLIRKAV